MTEYSADKSIWHKMPKRENYDSDEAYIKALETVELDNYQKWVAPNGQGEVVTVDIDGKRLITTADQSLVDQNPVIWKI